MSEPTKAPLTFGILTEREILRARAANPSNMHSLHEAYAVLLEEVEEFWDQVKLKASKRDHANILEELVQIAAMARRAAEDLGYVER